jgi:cytochrome c biogenesis protein
MKKIFRFLASIKLAIILLILLAVASILGTLIPQMPRGFEPQASADWIASFQEHYGKAAVLFEKLQLIKVYRSAWFLALLGIFALNLIVCTLIRLSPKYRRAFRPRLESDPENLLTLKTSARFKTNAPVAESADELKRLLAAAHYRVREAGRESRILYLARKRILGIFGSDVVHLGLLVVFAGGILSGAGSIRNQIELTNAGELRPVPGAAFDLRLDKFVTEYYPGDGGVKSWKSTLTILERQRPVRTQVVEVNRPLAYKGYSFYQMSYGWKWDEVAVEVWVKEKSDGAYLRRFKLKVGERALLKDKGQTAISVERFIPDFVLGEGSKPETRSLQPGNPAALIKGVRGGKEIFSGWIFANFPDFAQMHGAAETDLVFEFKSFDAGQYPVIEAAKDPGAVLIWLGCALVMLGLGLAFYWPTWEIKASIAASQGKTEVILGGIAAKSREAFGIEFERITTSLKRIQ